MAVKGTLLSFKRSQEHTGLRFVALQLDRIAREKATGTTTHHPICDCELQMIDSKRVQVDGSSKRDA